MSLTIGEMSFFVPGFGVKRRDMTMEQALPQHFQRGQSGISKRKRSYSLRDYICGIFSDERKTWRLDEFYQWLS